MEYYFYLVNEGYKYNSDLIILALESSNAEEINMHQIQFKKSYHKKTKTGLDIYFEDPKIIPYNITYLDIFRYKIVQTQLYEFVTSHSQLFNLVRWRLTQTLSPLSSANIINNTNKFFPTNFSPNHWVIKENGIEKKIVGLTRPKYVGIKILIEKIQNFVKNQGSEFFVFKIPYHNAVLERAVKTNYLNLLLPQTPIFDPLDNTGLFLNKYSIPLYFPGDIHFIPSGHKLMAYFLFNFLY